MNDRSLPVAAHVLAVPSSDLCLWLNRFVTTPTPFYTMNTISSIEMFKFLFQRRSRDCNSSATDWPMAWLERSRRKFAVDARHSSSNRLQTFHLVKADAWPAVVMSGTLSTCRQMTRANAGAAVVLRSDVSTLSTCCGGSKYSPILL